MKLPLALRHIKIWHIKIWHIEIWLAYRRADFDRRNPPASPTFTLRHDGRRVAPMNLDQLRTIHGNLLNFTIN
jgi:hypothetical protein